MKKLFSILSILTITLPAFAEDATPTPVVAEPTHADPATVATAQPGYALMNSHDTDVNAASAGYVKGAYNASIKAINRVANSVPLSSSLSSSMLSSVPDGRANVWIE